MIYRPDYNGAAFYISKTKYITMAVPIWKDHFSNLGAVASQYFRIRHSSTTVYQGRAVRAASSGNLYIRINDICADYMAQQAASVPVSAGSNVTFPMSFTVQKSSNGSSWTTVETVDFTDDWSFDDSFSGSSMGMAFPITGRVDLRQTIWQTRYAYGAVTATARYGSTTRSVSLSLNTSSGNAAYLKSLTHAGVGYVAFNCANYATYSGKTLTSVTIGLVTYNVANTCPRYNLLYKNPYGGYDTLLCEGSATRKHSTVRDTFRANYDNSVRGREEWNYMNEVTESIEMNTGYLTEDESSRMPYLLDSPDVFVQDLENTSVIIPAVIATDSYSFQTVNKLGMKMMNHTFEVKIAQNQYRR